VDFTLGLGNPGPDLGAAVSPARVHLRRFTGYYYRQNAEQPGRTLRDGGGYHAAKA